MRAWAAASVMALLFLAGCTAFPAGPSQAPSARAALPRAADSSGGGSEPAGPLPREALLSPASPSAASSPPAPAATWFLRERPAPPVGPYGPCTRTVFTLERVADGGPCEGSRGRRLEPVPAFEGDCRGHCYAAPGDFGAYPAGSRVEGVVYFTTDAADEISMRVSLLAGSATVGEAKAGPEIVVGLGGLACAPIPFSFTTDGPTTGDVVLLLRPEARESWFVGHGDGCASRFTVTPP